MRSHELICYPHDNLKKRCEEIKNIDASTRTLLSDMHEILLEKKGLGIAAPQVNSLKRCFLVKFEEEIYTFINPIISELSDEFDFYEEGCLSVPGVYADIERPIALRIQAQDKDGKDFSVEAEGLFARIIQHEMDHLNGVLFFDYLASRARNRLLKLYAQTQEELELSEDKH